MTRERPSAALASVAVIMLAAGLLIYHFTHVGDALTDADGQVPPGHSGQTGPTASPALSLVEAVTSRNLAALKAAVNAGADVNAPIADGSSAGMTPLHLAAAAPAAAVEAIRTLLAAGAMIDARTPDGRTPLMLAAEFGRVESLNALANANAAIDARDNSGKTALMYAAAAGRADAVKALLDAGASINAADDSGATALSHAAASPADARVLQFLLDNHADPDAADAAGVTPLMRAAEHADSDKILALLNAGAGTKAKSADGRTALDRAKTRTDDQGKRCAGVLEQAGP